MIFTPVANILAEELGVIHEYGLPLIGAKRFFAYILFPVLDLTTIP
jgi:hypothetical protein